MELTTQHASAAADLKVAMDAFVSWRIDVMPHIDRALAADPGFPMAHAFKGLFLFGGRNDPYRPVVSDCLRAATAGADAVSESERGYINALNALMRGRYDHAALAYEGILAIAPTDILAHRLLQQELFWGGEAQWMADVVDRATPAWRDDVPGFSAFQGVRAFSFEEAGRHAEAERAGRQSVEMDSGECWGTHAVAHVLVMQQRFREGVEWLEGLSSNWAGKNQIVHHLWWHLCLFLLEHGEHERILHLLDTQVRNPDSPLVQAVPDAYIDLQNVASILLRLELRGIEVGARWGSVVEYARARIDNFASPFTNAHAAAILAANGEFDAAAELLRSMERFARQDTGSMAVRYEQAAIPAAKAAIAHRKRDYPGVVNELMPKRRGLWQMGGSHAQRDVFTQLLVDALHRVGRHDYVNIVMNEARSAGFTDLQSRSFYRDAVGAVH